MKTATFIYKCRNCGKQYETGTTNEALGLAVFFSLVSTGQNKVEQLIGGSDVQMHGTHICDKDMTMYSVSDFIGVKIKKK